MSRYPQVLQLNQAGIPLRWINHEDAAVYYAKDQVLWELGDEDFTLFGGMSRLTGSQSQIRVRPIIAVKNENSASSARSHVRVRLTNRNLFNRDLHTCAYCATQYSIPNLTRDHIVPTSRGGANTWMNVVTACVTCNNVKGARTPEEADMPLTYAPYVPTYAENLILSNRKILGSQMDFLRPLVSPNCRALSVL